ncbi:cbb3-type cytochrome c oxidase subunit 3 [Rhodomicrobium lacus]|jgi:cytochrome c oxidase cbb3-type subunit 4|uniref:cbb3-type cytochrome c oxidase subunit 3 n=1 Tax=Rhodomicrobium TaxID=1068 RepID=UPI000F8D0342|nr:cbb3-type cytochrome c oxidase subunit 3 [Rhodomicrobium lacus]WKW50249.1 cbb3-type cytochrome c oxidase subunit 3 [Rhodomicrobium lacus]
MTYETVRSISAMTGLFVFVALFIAVLAFVFWPGNQKSFEEASRIPLDSDDFTSGGTNGR